MLRKFFFLLFFCGLWARVWAQDAHGIVGQWVGVLAVEGGSEFFKLDLKKEKDKIVGTFYDSSYQDGSFCFSEVEAKPLKQSKFIVEGKKIIRSKNSSTRIQNLSIIYFDFYHPDTIVAKVVEEGNYAALLHTAPQHHPPLKMARLHFPTSVDTPSDTEPMEDFSERTIPPPPPYTPTPIQTLTVQDSDKEDGDVIRVAFNGKLLQDILVARILPSLFPISLKKGKNVVSITSLSEGSIAPTTIRISILLDNRVHVNETLAMKKGETVHYEFTY